MKIAFNNAKSLHKHFRDVEFEPNVLSAEVIVFADSELCSRDADCHSVLNKFKLVRLDDEGHESVKRQHHGLVLYIKEYFDIQRIQIFHSAHGNLSLLPCRVTRKDVFGFFFASKGILKVLRVY